MQELVREFDIIHKHNLKYTNSNSQNVFLFFSEATMACVLLERFLRILPEIQATESDTLSNLLDKAFSDKRDVLFLLPQINKEEFKKLIRGLRNGIVHGNFEQLAKDANSASIEDYFGSGKFTKNIELLVKIIEYIIRQIDPETGKKDPVFRAIIAGEPLPPEQSGITHPITDEQLDMPV
jgi:hypothetical protein